MKNTVLEVNINNFLYNINKIKEYVGDKEIMPVVKANGYGTYINKRLDVLNHFNIIAVAEVQEAIEIRKIGYDKEIFVLNQPFVEELEDIHEYDITVGISEISFINRVDIPIKVHLEIESGMNRTGIQKKNWEEYFKIIKNNPNIIVEGIYTHFSSADTDSNYTNRQFSTFQEAVEVARKYFDFKYIHCSASNGILNFHENLTNLVRPGIIMYGYESFPGMKEIISIKPTTVLKTKISYIKEIDENEAISYNQKFITKSKMKVATIPIGYADGLKRGLTNKGYVYVSGEKRKILGSICMDSCMIDVTDLDVSIGDDVYLWDNVHITLDEIAEALDTISYEILCTIQNRIERRFIEK